MPSCTGAARRRSCISRRSWCCAAACQRELSQQEGFTRVNVATHTRRVQQVPIASGAGWWCDSSGVGGNVFHRVLGGGVMYQVLGVVCFCGCGWWPPWCVSFLWGCLGRGPLVNFEHYTKDPASNSPLTSSQGAPAWGSGWATLTRPSWQPSCSLPARGCQDRG